MNSYLGLLKNSTVVRMVLLSLLFRTVLNSQSLMLVLHVRNSLNMSYAAAGLVSIVVFVAMAGTELRRGLQLDRHGARRTIVRAMMVNGVCWVIAPFVPYPLLLVLAAQAAWFEIPVINVAKQAITSATTEEQRRPAMAAYEVTADVSLLLGPPLGVAAMAAFDTEVVLLAARLVVLLCGALLLVPGTTVQTAAPTSERQPARRAWLQTGFVAACLAYAAAAAVVSAEEMVVISMMHDFDAEGAIGLVMAVSAVGAMVGAYIYGLISRPISPYVILVGLGVGIIPCAFATGPVSLAIAMFGVGLLVGAVFPACTNRLMADFSDEAPGEAMGFHFSLMWVGIAVGSSVASQTVHFAGSSVGMLSTAAIGIGAGLVLGRLVARAPRKKSKSGRVRQPRIVAAARWVLDIAQASFAHKNDGTLEVFLGGKSDSGKRETVLVVEQRDPELPKTPPPTEPKSVGAGPPSEQCGPTPWTKAPPPINESDVEDTDKR